VNAEAIIATALVRP